VPWWVLVALAILLGALVAGLAAGARAADEDGKAVFDQLCAGCHTLAGGDGAGPDLQGLADRRDQAWVEAFIRDPAAVIASGDAYAKELADRFPAAMPTLGLSDAQLGAIVAYLGFTATAPTDTTPTETTPTQPAPLPVGDEDRGKRLFEGRESTEAGGPACLSCHSIAGVGALGGGQLGPDLTGAADRLGGQDGLAAWLSAIPSPTMAPIFGDRALADQERADLATFIVGAANAERGSGQLLKLIGLAVGIALIIAVVASAIWQQRLGDVRRPLVDRSTGRSS